MKASITIRIYLRSFRKIRKAFPAEKAESAAHYFERLAVALEEKAWEYKDEA